jgi:NADH:ubiquinone oxidoreductase subunit F (NADH-binding)
VTGTLAQDGAPIGSLASVRVVPGRLLTAAAADLGSHLTRNGPLPYREGSKGAPLLAEVEAAGLTGRGGAAFPTWRKLLAAAGGQRPVAIANAAEGEPASAKDATLLASAPHLVLDGLQLAAEAIGATDGYLYAKEGAALMLARRALVERRALGVDRVQVRVAVAPERFVAGEETAVLAGIEGRDALPKDKARLVVEFGLRGRPTLVHNAETLAHLALIARRGARWFREEGTSPEPGTFLATVTSVDSGTGPVVVEAPYGIPLGELISLAGVQGRIGAVLLGGFHGGWLPTEPGLRLPVSRAALAPWDASPGAGVVLVLPPHACGLDASARILGYLAEQSARQCGPCLSGLPRLAQLAAELAAAGNPGNPGRLAPAGAPRGPRPNPGLPFELERLSALVSGRGACHHPDGSVRMLRTALRTFGSDVSAHLAGHCGAGR